MNWTAVKVNTEYLFQLSFRGNLMRTLTRGASAAILVHLMAIVAPRAGGTTERLFEIVLTR